jgi:Uma2 family endonuclease
MRRRILIPAFLPLAFGLAVVAAVPAAAITQCQSCTCSMSCTAFCTTATGSSTCGATGYCVGGANCGGGGGCLSPSDVGVLVDELFQERQPATREAQERGRVAARLTWRLARYVEESGLGEVYTAETGFRLPALRGRVQTPDLAFVSREAQGGIPDLVVELRSTLGTDVTVTRWLQAGTRAVLVVDAAARTVAVHQKGAGSHVLSAEETLDLPEIVPGWSVRVGDLFD